MREIPMKSCLSPMKGLILFNFRINDHKAVCWCVCVLIYLRHGGDYKWMPTGDSSASGEQLRLLQQQWQSYIIRTDGRPGIPQYPAFKPLHHIKYIFSARPLPLWTWRFIDLLKAICENVWCLNSSFYEDIISLPCANFCLATSC